MSRVGKKPISIPSGVKVSLSGRTVSVAGPKGNLSWEFPETATVAVDDASKTVSVNRRDDRKQSRANHGLTRALIAGMVEGVEKGFEKKLEIYGTGYGCKLAGRILQLNIGFSGRGFQKAAQYELPVPEGIEIIVERETARGDGDPAVLIVKGCSKQQVGQFAAEIRALRKTEPYKGKGIRYHGEQVRRKQGKALAGA